MASAYSAFEWKRCQLDLAGTHSSIEWQRRRSKPHLAGADSAVEWERFHSHERGNRRGVGICYTEPSFAA